MGRRLPYILAFVIPFAVYSPTLLGVFYYDDNVVFFGHQARVLAQDPLSVFGSGTHYLPGAPRSLHVFALLIIYRMFGASPLPYHVFNLMMHSATTLLVFLLLKRLLKEGGFRSPGWDMAAPLLGSLVFGLNPIHVENITFVTLGGTDIFYAFWALLSLMCYIRFRDKSFLGWKNYVFLAGSVLAYVFALLSKESAVAFIAMYPLTEFVLGRRGFLWALPHAASLAMLQWGVLTNAAPSLIIQVAGAKAGAAGPMEILKSLGFFAKGMVIPYPHMPYIKEFREVPLLYAFAALSVAWLVAGVISKRRIITYSALWFGVVSVPYLFVPAAVQNVAVTAERYIYAPSIALALLGGWVIASGLNSGKLRAAVKPAVVVLLLAYGALGTVYFYQAWRTEEAFWRYAARTSPEFVSGYSNLASVVMEKGNMEEAKTILEEGLGKEKGMPQEFAQAAYALADIYRREGDVERAERYYVEALRHYDYEFALMDLGFLYLDTNRPEMSIRALEGALKYRRSPRALAGLALAHLRLGNKKAAEGYAREAYAGARDAKLRDFAEGLIREASK